MTLGQLVSAYFQHYTIVVYMALAAIGLASWALFPAAPLRTAGAVLAALVIYPLVWHLLHQHVLHGQWMYRFKPLAATWKRIHYDHHQDPNHLEVLFGALHTTLPTIVLATAPVGWLIGGAGGAFAAFATGILTTAYYEFMHCIQHLSFKPKWKWVQFQKQRHNEHHYFHENGNFGITNMPLTASSALLRETRPAAAQRNGLQSRLYRRGGGSLSLGEGTVGRYRQRPSPPPVHAHKKRLPTPHNPTVPIGLEYS